MRILSIFLQILLMGSAAIGEEPDAMAKQAALIAQLRDSFVQVEINLTYDNGEPPYGGGMGQRCPNCGQYHSYSDLETNVDEERPLQYPGVVLGENRVLTADPGLESRFIKSIVVISGEQRVEAKPVGIVPHQSALIVETGQPLASAKSVTFAQAGSQDLFQLTYGRANTLWSTSARPFAPALIAFDGGKQYMKATDGSLVVTGSGSVVAVSIDGSINLERDWSKSPSDWNIMSMEEMNRHIEALRKAAGNGLLATRLNLRSPKKSEADDSYSYRYGYGGDDANESATERFAVAALIGERRLVIPMKLEISETARLERIAAFTADGKALTATFAYSMRDYGLILADLDEPHTAGLRVDTRDIREYRDALMLRHKAELHGKEIRAHYHHTRISGFEDGFRGQIYPTLASDDGTITLFNMDAELVAMQVARRIPTVEEYQWDSGYPELMPMTYLMPLIENPDAHADPSNVPQSEEEESRIAWLGVELQALDSELARANEVSAYTQDGENGALVSYVYEGSPAADAGIEVGDVLLRINVENRPAPINVQIQQDYSFMGMGGFPWDQLDQVPAEYFSQIPKPWPGVENNFTRTLTNLGFGTRFEAEVVHDGEIVMHDFEVVVSPTHFDGAPRYNDDALGITVRDLTYEVRRFMQYQEDDAGVIVSKIEPGDKAAVAGLRPYEVITHVNDAPVMSAEQFGTLVADAEELRLSVRRMTRERVVRIKK